MTRDVRRKESLREAIRRGWKKFEWVAWVHPSMGDDRMHSGTLWAKDEARAGKVVEKFLRRKGSEVMNDYTVKAVRGTR